MTSDATLPRWGGVGADLVEALPDPVLLVRPVLEDDRVVEALVLDVNPLAVRQIGRTRAEMVGRRIVADLGADSEMLRHIELALGEPGSFALDNYQVPDQDPRGRLLIDVRTVRAGTDVLVCWRDVTAYADVLDAAVEASHRQRLVAENAFDAVYLRDPDGVVLWVSASIERLLGCRPEALVGSDLLEIVHPDDVAVALGARVALARDPDASQSFVARFRDESGQHRHMAVATHSVVEDGAVVGATIGLRDIDALVVAQGRAEESERLYRLLAEHSSDVIFLSNEQTDLIWVSPSSRDTLGWPAEQLAGRRAVEFIHPDELAMLRENVTRSTRSGATIRVRYRWRRPDGSYRWVEALGRPILAEGQARRVVQLRDVHDEVLAVQELARRARWDSLTGLLNRSEFLRLLAARLDDRRGHRLALAFCDLDDLKGVNDALGHAAGDRLLGTCAERIRSCLREQDLVGRVGGDELLVLLDGVDDRHDATAIAEKIREAVRSPWDLGATTITTTVSIGVTLVVDGDDIDSVVARADKAMYAAKAAGRDRVVLADT